MYQVADNGNMLPLWAGDSVPATTSMQLLPTCTKRTGLDFLFSNNIDHGKRTTHNLGEILKMY